LTTKKKWWWKGNKWREDPALFFLTQIDNPLIFNHAISKRPETLLKIIFGLIEMVEDLGIPFDEYYRIHRKESNLK